jgi:hypothetical protein
MAVRHVHTTHGSLLAPRVMGVLSPRGHDASSSHAVLSICFADVSCFTTARCPASAASGSDGCRGSRVARSSGVAAPPVRPTVASCGGLRSARILQRATRRPAFAPRLRILLVPELSRRAEQGRGGEVGGRGLQMGAPPLRSQCEEQGRGRPSGEADRRELRWAPLRADPLVAAASNPSPRVCAPPSDLTSGRVVSSRGA